MNDLEITPNLLEMAPEGLVGQIVVLEDLADQAADKAKGLNVQAKRLRQLVIDKMKQLNLTSVSHKSGYRAGLRVKTSIAVADKQKLLDSLKKLNLVNFVMAVPEQVIPAHLEVNWTLFEKWFETASTNQKLAVDGLGIEVKESLVITSKK